MLENTNFFRHYFLGVVTLFSLKFREENKAGNLIKSQLKMNRFSSIFVLLLFSFVGFSQDLVEGEYVWHSELKGQLGLVEEPLPEDPVSDVTYQGEYLDFSGGYQEGEQVSDFTLWNESSERFNLRTLLEESSNEGKYTILISGSNSCVRFTEFFNENNLTSGPVIEFMNAHLDDFNWKVVYGIEAHPIDLENCASNCPITVLAGPSGVGEFQHTTVESRDQAVARWVGINDGTVEVPDYIYTYTPGTTEPTGQTPFDYVPSFPDIEVWPDNPDNLIYDSFFKRPFGIVVVDCSGLVVARGDWFGLWMLNGPEGSHLNGMDILLNLLDSSPTTCSDWVPFCDEQAQDNDGDGLCNNLELENGTDMDDPCSPYGEDSDFDGLCDGLEIALGTLLNDWDTDDDGVSDQEEYEMGTDPLDASSTTSIEEIEIRSITYPNPSSGIFYLKIRDLKNVYITNVLGAKQELAVISEEYIDLSQLSSGIYFLKGESILGKPILERLIKE